MVHQRSTLRMKVSVLMTYYNKAAHVEEAVRSVLSSTLKDLELLVVDDGSTDDGIDRLGRMHDPRIRILAHSKNTGRAAAANRGFDAAAGEYVAILDADDRMAPDRLERQVAFMDAHPEIGACGTGTRLIGRSTAMGTWPATDRECRGKLLFADPMLHGSVMFRRGLLVAYQLRCDATWRIPGMDYLFQVAISPHVRFANLPEPLTFYRIHEGNLKHGRDEWSDRLRIQQRAFELLGIPVDDERMALHLHLHGLFRTVPGSTQVRALRAWCNELIRLNRERRLFPAEVFEQEVQDRWLHLFYVIADRDPYAALTHVQLTKGCYPGRYLYLLKVTLRRWSGIGPKRFSKD